MARIYVSSTYGDLKDHREHVYRTLRQLNHEVVAMEDYVAADQRPLERCLADVAASDLYVGVFAHRYGYIPDKDNPERRSITELEYRHARAKGKASLVFLLDPEASWPATSMDAITGDNEGGGRIRALREELGRERLVSFFATAHELAQKVSVAVTNQVQGQHSTGQPPVASGRGWTIPPPVPSFTGRDEQLAAVRAQLTDQGVASLVPTMALTGVAGVGKTQLALAYAQRYRGEYTIGWWVPSETKLGMLTALAELGAVLGLPVDQPPAELAVRTRDALGGRSGWLLIFDNARDLAAVAEYLPGSGGHVLVTSRNSAWQGIAESIQVDLLSLEDAVELLVRRTADADRRGAAELAEALGRLPLALEQAGAYTSQHGLTLAEYLELFIQRREELLGRGTPLAYHGTVDATFTLAVDQLRERSPATVQLLELCAVLAPDEIPLPAMFDAPQLLPEPLRAASADALQRREVVGLLYQTGLLTRDIAGTARMHRLLQDVTLAHLSETNRHQRVADALELLAALFPYEGYQPAVWPRCAQLLTHAQSVVNHARSLKITTSALALLQEAIGIYLWGRGLDVRLAQELHEESLAMRQQLYDGDHHDVADSLTSLALDLDELNEHERAAELHEQALAMRKRLFGGDHPTVARSMGNLSISLQELGKFERARELQEQALAMFQRLYDGDHPEVAASLSNVSVHLRRVEDYERARELQEQSLAMFQRLYDGDHPHVAIGLGNLAVDLRTVEDYERARELQEQALAMFQRLYDGDHPHVAIGLGNLAIDLRALGQDKRARELEEQALAMRQRLAERQSASSS